jgi:EAL domain-containing protein (putative c-di-GMP-specific phosphodiesterase class I)/FixJ family two-component response regulator
MDETTPLPLRVLVVDDDAACVRALAGMLRHVGPHDVDTAASADEAVERLNVAAYDLILCDLNMPGRDGVETMRLLAERQIRCPILLMSGVDHKILKAAQELGNHRGLGVAGILHKPFGLEQIRGALAHVAQVTSPRSQRPAPVIPIAELAHGIEAEQLILYYQPQLNLHTCQLEGAEALVRWQHPEHGLLLPEAFISLAESSGLISPLTDWVMREAIRQAALWRRSGVDLGVSVNLSAQTLRELDLPDRIAASTEQAGLNSNRITLEITESGMPDDVDSLLDITTRLRIKGFLLAIDDFGTGFSSLTQLKRLPFTELKLDRTFVSGAATDGDARSLLESSVNLAKRLQLKTVAEGIETEDEWNLLVWMGVDLGQGYHMARPMAADALLPWYTGWQAQVA